MLARHYISRCQYVPAHQHHPRVQGDSSLMENDHIATAFLIVLFRVLEIPLENMPTSSVVICTILQIFHSEFQNRGGLKRQTVLQCLSGYDLHLRARLAYQNSDNNVRNYCLIECKALIFETHIASGRCHRKLGTAVQ